jgi:hypothetical protein
MPIAQSRRGETNKEKRNNAINAAVAGVFVTR